MKNQVKLLAAALVLAAPAAGQAQEAPIYPSVDWSLYNSGTLNNIVLKGVADRQRNGTATRGNKPGGYHLPGYGPDAKAAKAAPAAAGKTASLAYVPTPALKAATVQGYMDRLKTQNPAASQAVAANFGAGKHDYGQIYAGIVKPYGIRPNDAGDAMVAYMLLGYLIVNDIRAAVAATPAQVQGVRQQLGPKLAANPQLTSPGTPAKLGEEMKLLFVVVQGGWQSSLREGKLAEYRQGVAAMFQNQYGLDFTKLKLTDQGFAAK